MDQSFFLLMGAMLLVMWFFFIRPQKKQADAAKEFQKNLEKGAKVVTTGGIHGKVFKVEENGSVMLEIDNNVKIRIERSGISMEMTKAAYPAEDKKAESAEAKK